MLRLVETHALDTVPVWMVQMKADFASEGRGPAGDDDLEPMVELLQRTDGVCSAAVVPLQAGLAVAVGLSAPDATTAVERARALVAACGRYAGLGRFTIHQLRVAMEPNAGTA